MSLAAIVGDATTTTTLALATGWRSDEDVLVVEADRRGGSLAAWLDIPVRPSLSTVVTRVGDGPWPTIDGLARTSPSGVRLVPAPVRALEAASAVDEASRHVFPALAALDHPVVLADVGAVSAADRLPAVAAQADVCAVVHRQATQSARAAGVRLARLAEVVEMVAAVQVPVLLVVVGSTPFDPIDIAAFVAEHLDRFGLGVLPEDALAAAVLAGRTGVSAKRFARLPLTRAAAEVAARLDAALAEARGARRWSVP